MHPLQERDPVEVTHASSWPEWLGVADGPGLATRKLDASRCRDVGQPLPCAGRRAGGVADRARVRRSQHRPHLGAGPAPAVLSLAATAAPISRACARISGMAVD